MGIERLEGRLEERPEAAWVERGLPLPGPRFGILLPMWSHRFRSFGIAVRLTSSETGTRGSFTMPDSMASIREKSVTVHGKRVPSA